MAKPNDKPAAEPRLIARTARHRLVDVSRKPPLVAVADVVAAFGARALGINSGDDKAPVALLTIRDALMQRLRSTGGRPALSGDGSRQRVQVSAEDWKSIVDIASHMEVGRHKASPAQVASALIHLALERIPQGEITALVGAVPED
jgi:sugar phosphate isomerase/epimerase